MSSVICFENVSKRFILHHERARSFQELLINSFHRRNGSREEFWALRDVSFCVEAGETLGIVGENGAGKTTILKLIARILEPTSGVVSVRGRVAGLLELGAGFHPDLTGRENIFLNGSLMGLGRAAIQARLEEIIHFAELEHFIDVPIKHYSSGMHLRLGFAIAIALDPDILLTDEILAVGDEAFQRKCLERIQAYRQGGRTVVLVSHDMNQVRAFCTRAIWLEQGKIRAMGDVYEVTDLYLRSIHESKAPSSPGRGASPSLHRHPHIQITAVRMLDQTGQESPVIQRGANATIEVDYVAHPAITDPIFSISIYRHPDGLCYFGTTTCTDGVRLPPLNGRGTIRFSFDRFPLLAGDYWLDAVAHSRDASHAHPGRGRLYFTVYADAQDTEAFSSRHQWIIGAS
jgi:lipopolysaccharide transport system ATP-binding protein